MPIGILPNSGDFGYKNHSVEQQHPTTQLPAPAWIIFDAVGTLIEPHPPVAEAYARVGRKFGSRLSVEQVRTRFRQAFASLEERDVAGDLVTSEEIERQRWREIVVQVFDDIADTAACFEELFGYFGRPAAWRCYDDAEPTLRELSRRGYRLGIASNFDERLRPVLNGLAIGPLLELYAVSSTIGYRKPSPRFFERVIALADTSPQRVLFIGDDPVNDVQPATAAGMAALQIDREASESPDCLSDLRQLLSRPPQPDFRVES